MTATDRRFTSNRGRKAWHCAECETIIKPGVIHYYWHSGNPEGERRLCPGCQDTLINTQLQLGASADKNPETVSTVSHP